MKKSIRININGVIFNIDEDAYEVLKKYLNRLRKHFGPGESTNEIISDIESRIAEIFIEHKSSNDNVITIEMVKTAITAMGEPDEIDGEEEDSKHKSKKNTSYSSEQYTKTKRKLYRDPDNKVVGGVSAGLGIYFNIDPIWIRIAFVLLTISGMSILVYIVLWIAIPEAKTTAQKLEMRGEAINLENIEKSIRDEFENINDKFKDIKNKHFSKKKDELTIFEKLAHFILRVIEGIIKFIGVILGILLAFIALIIILALLPVFFGGGLVVMNQLSGIHMVPINGALNLFTQNPADINLLTTAIALVLLIPLIALVYQGIKLIFGLRTKNSIVGISLLTLWIIGLIILVFSGVRIGDNFNHKAMIDHKIDLNTVHGDTLYVDIINTDSLSSKLPLVLPFTGQHFVYKTTTNFFMNPSIRTHTLDSNATPTINIETVSHGQSHFIARHNSEKITYQYRIEGDTIHLSNYFHWPSSIKFRAQKVNIILGIPKGMVIKYSPRQYTSKYDLNNNQNIDILDFINNNPQGNYLYINNYLNKIVYKCH